MVGNNYFSKIYMSNMSTFVSHHHIISIGDNDVQQMVSTLLSVNFQAINVKHKKSNSFPLMFNFSCLYKIEIVLECLFG